MSNASDSSNKDLQLVPETILKKRHDLDELKRKRDAQVRRTNKVFSKSSKFYIRKPETFLARAKNRRNNEIRYKRVMKKGMQKRASNKKEFSTMEVEVEGENEVIKYQSNSVGTNIVFVVRIRNDVGVSKMVKTVLRNLNLKEQYEGVFVQYTPKNRKFLQLVEPFVLYGPPSKNMVSDLINRRGHGIIDGERIPLSDNTIIEKALGDESGIICVEDLVHELYSAGSGFSAASQFLWPFRLTAPKTEFESQKLNDKDGKIYGDRGDEIDRLIKLML